MVGGGPAAVNARARAVAHGQGAAAAGSCGGRGYHSGGHVQQPVAQRLGLGQCEGAVQQQRLGPAGEVLGGQDQLQPDLVARQRSNGRFCRPVALAARMRSSTRARWRWRSSSRARSRPGWSVTKTWKRWPSWSVKRSWAPGWASSRRQIARVPSGQLCRSTQPVSSTTSAPALTWPSGSTAGVQAASGWARIASRRWASIGMPRVKATWCSRRCQASLVLAPALSLRTRTGWSPADRGS